MRKLRFAGTWFKEKVYFAQIDKRKARNLHKEGRKIYVQTSNFSPLGIWSKAYQIDPIELSDFDQFVNSFTWYNCINTETGLYPVFYINLLDE